MASSIRAVEGVWMWGVAALVSVLLVTASVAAAVGRLDIGWGIAAATTQVARSTAYWRRPALYPPPAAEPAPNVELLTPDPPRRWAWSADDLPQPLSPGRAAVRTPSARLAG